MVESWLRQGVGFDGILALPSIILAHKRGHASSSISYADNGRDVGLSDMLRLGSGWQTEWNQRLSWECVL
jgi:hypothetical protein